MWYKTTLNDHLYDLHISATQWIDRQAALRLLFSAIEESARNRATMVDLIGGMETVSYVSYCQLLCFLYLNDEF